MKVKEKKFLCKGYGGKEIGQTAQSFGLISVQNDDECRVDKDGQGNGGMPEVVEMVGGDGVVAVEWLVPFGADKELHGNGGCVASHDKKGLGVPELRRWEP
ncbi:hypothetical protein TorRG33x02_270700 [Trema orientale]|uniref:Uncharacterized protein n=1 Tax=Trema orientale TaxID=63057 RepID=A0A2P5CWN9_TREOI|nr:hypothetical protein TorRG33x02_270700 [Trema orientale]